MQGKKFCHGLFWWARMSSRSDLGLVGCAGEVNRDFGIECGREMMGPSAGQALTATVYQCASLVSLG